MPSKELLLFDLGGVLVENVGFERLATYLREPIESATLKAKWLASPSVRAFELGQIAPELFASSFVAEWDLACRPDLFLRDFASWPKGFYAGTEALLAALRSTHRLACLSNSNALHWTRFDEFRGVFDVALSSHLLGSIKPDAECFQSALMECGVGPEAVRFFDDSLPNVEAASRLGMRAFLVDGPADLITCLRAEGLLP